MLFGKRNKKPDERVLELKARVDALRHADESRREATASLDTFLQGDDVLTGREIEEYEGSVDMESRMPAGQASPGADVDLEAELEKYLQREKERERLAGSSPEASHTAQEAAGLNSPPAGSGATLWPAAPEPETPGESKWSKEDWPPEEEWPPAREAS